MVGMVGMRQMGQGRSESADTPSQKTQTGDKELDMVVLPTAMIALDVDSVEGLRVKMGEAMEKFTLQRVWDERSVAPGYIYALVVEVDEEGKYIRLQDEGVQEQEGWCSQPSVEWVLQKEQWGYCEMIERGWFVLLERACVQPNGNSFFVIAKEHTVVYFKRAGEMVEGEGRAAKRRRKEVSARESMTAVDERALKQVANAPAQREFVVYARAGRTAALEAWATHEIECEHGASIRVAAAGGGERAVQLGDELLFEGVRWSVRSGGWTARRVRNVCTMDAALHSALVRRLRRVSDVALLQARARAALTTHMLAAITACERAPCARDATLLELLVVDPVDGVDSAADVDTCDGATPLRVAVSSARHAAALRRGDARPWLMAVTVRPAARAALLRACAQPHRRTPL